MYVSGLLLGYWVRDCFGDKIIFFVIRKLFLGILCCFVEIVNFWFIKIGVSFFLRLGCRIRNNYINF